MSLFCCEALQIITDRCAGTGRGLEVRTLFSVPCATWCPDAAIERAREEYDAVLYWSDEDA